MRIAILLSGHLRSFRSTKKSFYDLVENLRQVGEVDVFCHTWDIEESQTGSWWKKNASQPEQVEKVNEEEFIDTYSPVAYKIDGSKQFDASMYKIPSPVPIAGYLSMFYTVNEGYKIFSEYCQRTNKTYDILFRARYDLDYEVADSIINDLESIIKEKEIHMPNSNPYEVLGGYSDVFAIGPSQEMKTYFEFYTNFKEAVDHYVSLGYKELFPELCLPLYLKSKSIKVKRLESMRLSIVRKNGDRFLVNSAKSFTNNAPVCFYREHVEKFKNIVPAELVNIEDIKSGLVMKYISWLDPSYKQQQVENYLKFYWGDWISIKEIKDLIRSAKNSKAFEPGVMKNFFEEVLRNAKYSFSKKILLAFLLYKNSSYGFFFFRLLINMSKKRVQPKK